MNLLALGNGLFINIVAIVAIQIIDQVSESDANVKTKIVELKLAGNKDLTLDEEQSKTFLASVQVAQPEEERRILPAIPIFGRGSRHK